MGQTPVSLRLSRRGLHVIRLELDGYRPLEIRISKKRPPLAETVMTAIPWAPIGAVVVGYPIFLVWNAAHRPEGEWGGMGQAAVSAAIGFFTGWAAGIVIDLKSPSNYDLSPGTLAVELEPVGSPASLSVIEMDAEELREIRWIRIRPKPGR
jgi:hypothetical protein